MRDPFSDYFPELRARGDGVEVPEHVLFAKAIAQTIEQPSGGGGAVFAAVADENVRHRVGA
jgi:hypothetical protein